MWAGILREVGNYPDPDRATLDDIQRLIQALEEGGGRGVAADWAREVAHRLAEHWNRLLQSRANYPGLEAQLERLLRSRELYFQERSRLEPS